MSSTENKKGAPDGFNRSGSLLPAARTGERKIEHVRLCLQEDVAGQGITSGLERYVFKHCALPELHFDEVRLDTTF